MLIALVNALFDPDIQGLTDSCGSDCNYPCAWELTNFSLLGWKELWHVRVFIVEIQEIKYSEILILRNCQVTDSIHRDLHKTVKKRQALTYFFS